MYDKLEVRLTLKKSNGVYDEEYPAGCHFIGQEVFVNGCKFEGYLELAGLFAETSEFTDEQKNTWYNEEYKQQNLWYGRSNGRYSSVYLDSCSCGAAGCAGIWNGVKVNKKKNAYLYRAKKKDGYDNGILGTGKWNLWLYKDNIESLRKEIVSFLKGNKEKLVDSSSESRYLICMLNI